MTISPAELNQLRALFNARRYAELEVRARTLLDLKAGSGLVWELFGMSLQMQGKDALHAFQKTAELMPDDAGAQYNLGNILKNLGCLDEAAACYRKAIKLKPDFAEAHSNLGNVLKDKGSLDLAVASYRNALKIKPNSADVYNNLGTALKELGQRDNALANFRLAVKVRPDYADAHYNLGNVMIELGQYDGAAECSRRALEIKPDFAEAHNNLGLALKELGQFDAAITCFQRALESKPDFAEALINLGAVQQWRCQFDRAAENYRRAVEIKPDYAKAHNNLGAVLQELGQFDDAAASYRRALAFSPDYLEAQSNLLFTLNYTSHAPDVCLEEARKFGRMASSKVSSRFSAWQCEDQPQRLRVGIVSGDLHNHPVSYALKSMLEFLDPARIELIAYPTNHKTDDFTDQLKPYFAAWKPLYGLGDETAVRLIHDDGVHVLLDLSGHTGNNRLPVFAWKPAPVQASWLGYFATTGVAEMDYLLTSEAAVPREHQGQYTETLWYLPDTWLCFTPPDVDLQVALLPALNNGHLTFGCFQRLDKLSKEVLPAWSRILSAVPNARLRIACKQLGDAAQAAQFSERLQQHGIDPARVSLQGLTSSRKEYLERYNEVDVMLDSFPYPGVTTTCEALWMGVPTITLAGATLLSRQGVGVLTAVGLQDWIAGNVEDYIAKAVALAGDLPKLAALRAGLRERARTSPLFDAKRFAHNFEDAMWNMWQRYRDIR